MAVSFYISVDVETSGPAPGRYSLLSIGAVPVDGSAEAFYVEVQPVGDLVDPAVLAVSGLDPARLAETGTPPEAGMRAFADWVGETTPPGRRPVFVGMNAPFDWMFVADYFDRYLGRNPFGHAALDLKSLYMGATGVPWSETGFAAMKARYGLEGGLVHHAARDAADQAEVVRLVFAEIGISTGGR